MEFSLQSCIKKFNGTFHILESYESWNNVTHINTYSKQVQERNLKYRVYKLGKKILRQLWKDTFNKKGIWNYALQNREAYSCPLSDKKKRKKELCLC